MDEKTYRKWDIIIKGVIAFFLLCLMFVSCGIKKEISYIDVRFPDSIGVHNDGRSFGIDGNVDIRGHISTSNW